jgi:hypothetical protein
LRRVVRRGEAHLAGRIVAGGNEQQALVLAFADPDREADVGRFFVERDVLGRRRAEPVIARAIAAPIVVDLGEDDALAVVRPDGGSDADLGDRLQVLSGSEITDAQGEALRPIVVDQRGEELAVR